MSRRLADERGAALVTVMLALMMLTAVGLVMMGFATNQSRATGFSRDFETAVHAAESGADEVILRMFDNTGYTTGQVFSPAAPGGPAQERAWAIQQFDAALAAGTGNFVRVGDATGLGIRPTQGGVAMDRIYAVGRITVAGVDRTRVLRLTVASGTYIPQHALLTNGDVELNGATNARVTGDSGHVHANGDVETSGNPTVSGNVTATGSVQPSNNFAPGAVTSGHVRVPVPNISARSLYPLRTDYSSFAGSTYTGTWYDLCPDRTVRPPAPDGGLPCSNTTVVGNGDGSGFRGWTFRTVPIPEWTFSTTGLWSGAYYVYGVKATILGAPPGTSLTVIAEEPAAAGHAGSIHILGAPVMTPHVQGIAMLADRDIRFLGTGASGLDVSGLVAAGEQIDISGNAAIRGPVIAENDGTDSNLVAGDHEFGGSGFIRYDGGLATALPGVVRITHWNEL